MTVSVVQADARDLPLPDASVDLIVTSPPYFGLRSYTDGGEHYAGQVGSEATPAAWLASMLDCTREMIRVLKPSGSLFINLGDKYNTAASGQKGTLANGYRWQNDTQGRRYPSVPGLPPKSLLGLPWRYALAVTDQLGLILRAEIIWSKPNGLPESVTDRVRRAHEQVFHFTVRPRYYSAVDEIREPQASIGRRQGGPNGRDHRLEDGRGAAQYAALETLALNPLGKLPGSVWSIPSQPLTVPPALGADHFAAFPMELPRRLILGWSPPGVCTGCGEGRRPIAAADYRVTTADISAASKRLNPAQGNNFADRRWDRALRQTTITGYACACPQPDAPTSPALVVDGFGGTGTTALLAHVNGRHGISVDRSADYCRIAAWRTQDPGERARAMQVDKPPIVHADQGSLFDLAASP